MQATYTRESNGDYRSVVGTIGITIKNYRRGWWSFHIYDHSTHQHLGGGTAPGFTNAKAQVASRIS